MDGGAKSGDSDKTTVGRDENCMNWFDIALLRTYELLALPQK